jgi:hypothetical protein
MNIVFENAPFQGFKKICHFKGIPVWRKTKNRLDVHGVHDER